MWKIVGSVHQDEDRSIRSNLSREEIPFISFRQTLKNKSQHRAPQKDRSFCVDYFQRRKEEKRSLSLQISVSEHDRKYGKTDKQDIFSSMRNVMKEDQVESRFTSRKSQSLQGQKKIGKMDKINLKQTISKLEGLKKQQKKLKKSLETEFNGLKNMFYQFEEVAHAQMKNQVIFEKAPANQTISYDHQLLKQIMMEALSVEKYFAQMDRKKAQLMNRLDNG